jgi:hypothetical protein
LGGQANSFLDSQVLPHIELCHTLVFVKRTGINFFILFKNSMYLKKRKYQDEIQSRAVEAKIEPIELLEHYSEEILSSNIAKAACEANIDELKRLITPMVTHDVLKGVYDIIAMKSCLDLDPESDVISIITLNNNEDLLKKLLDSLIIHNSNGKNSAAISLLTLDYTDQQAADALINSLKFLPALDYVETLDIFFPGHGTAEITKKDTQRGIFNSIIPLSGQPPSSSVVNSYRDLLLKMDPERQNSLLHSIKYLDSPELNSVESDLFI